MKDFISTFYQVFGASPSCDMNEKFWDILAFCHQVSHLMVSEIRKRASNQSTEAASSAIATFLEIENCEESSNGWMLLSTLNLLAAGNATLIQVIKWWFTVIFNTYLYVVSRSCRKYQCHQRWLNVYIFFSIYRKSRKKILIPKIVIAILLLTRGVYCCRKYLSR